MGLGCGVFHKKSIAEYDFYVSCVDYADGECQICHAIRCLFINLTFKILIIENMTIILHERFPSRDAMKKLF